MATLHEVLERAPLFRGLSDTDRAALAGTMRPRKLAGGEALFRQGQTGDSMAIVVEGAFVVRCEEPDGREVVVAKIDAGNVVGEMACLDPAPRSATVEATNDAVVWVLDRTMFKAMKDNAPSLAVAFMDGLAEVLTGRLRETNARIESATAALEGVPGPGERRPTAAPDRRPAGTGIPYGGPLELKDLPSLKGFTPAELGRLAEVAPPSLFRGGDYLCREGDPGDACFVVARGKVDVVRDLEGGERVLATLPVGAMVGQLALLDDAPRSACVRANQDAVVLRIARADFRRLLEAHDSLALKLHEQVTVAGVRQIRLANGHITRLLARPRAESPKTAASTAEPSTAKPAMPRTVTTPRSSMPRTEVEPRKPVFPPNEPRPRKPAAEPRAHEPEDPFEGLPAARSRTAPAPSSTRPAPPVTAKAPAASPKSAPLVPPPPASKPAGEPKWKSMLERAKSAVSGKKPADFRSVAEGRVPTHAARGRSVSMEEYLQTALGEWGLDLDDLDKVKVVRPPGEMTLAEKKIRNDW